MKRIYWFIGSIILIVCAVVLMLAPEVSLYLLRRTAQETSGTPDHAAAVATYLGKCKELGVANELRKEDFQKIGVVLPPKTPPLSLPWLAPQPNPAGLPEESFFVELAPSKQIIILTFSTKTGTLVSWDFLPSLPPLPY